MKTLEYGSLVGSDIFGGSIEKEVFLENVVYEE